MPRSLVVAACQMGPIARSASRAETLERLIAMMHEAKARGATLVVYTEAALTPFFPHWFVATEDELDAYCEAAMPNPAVQKLFDTAARLEIGFNLGYAEIAHEDGRKRRYNTSILVGRDGRIVGKYRKIHLPGYVEPRPQEPFQNLEKRYFAVGNLGFRVWPAFGGKIGLCICNDRRWPETWRVLGLQGVELVLLGYNTPVLYPSSREQEPYVDFHNHLSMQAGAYQNATWVVGVAKAGIEEGVDQIGGTCIIHPSGTIVAQASGKGDEVVTATIDLDATRIYKETTFNFAQHRRPEHYGLILERTGVGPMLGR
jgi:predicted amidohydrolase